MSASSGVPDDGVGLRGRGSHEAVTTGSRPDTVWEIVARSADRYPDRPALLAPDRASATYADLRGNVERIRTALAGAGLRSSDTIALVARNGPEAATAFLGISSLAACAPLNPAFGEQELEFFLEDLRAGIVVVHEGLEPAVVGPAARVGVRIVRLSASVGPAGSVALDGLEPSVAPTAVPEPSDVALVLHTSGTTARPKVVALSQRNLSVSADNVATTLELTPGDRCLNVMPLFHIHGLVAALLASIRAGASVVCAPTFQGPCFLDWLTELEPTWYTAVPTMHQAVLARAIGAGGAPSHRLRFVRSSSAPLPVSVLEGLESVLAVPVVEAYGMTEAAHQMTSNPLPPGKRVPGSVGLPAGPQVAILDAAGAELGSGAVGEVAIRGDSVFAGYSANPEANAAAFSNGWFRTGDEGLLDEHGYLYLRGRIKEIINRGGEKIAPAEVDDVLLRHPGVAEAVTFGIPDPRLGEEVAAAVVLAGGAGELGERELQDHVASTAAPFKVPRRIVVLDEIPKGPTGKVQRLSLGTILGLDRAHEHAPPAGTGTPPRTVLERAVCGVFSDVLEVPTVTGDDDFFALGGDSILGAEVMARLRDLTGRTDVPLVALARASTPIRLAAELEEPGDPDSVVVPLATGAARPAVFLSHGADVIGLPAIASRLTGDHAVYALRPPGLGGSSIPAETVEEIVDAFFVEVKGLQPEGPYVLAGVCSGGPMMIELARRLVEDGEDVGPVVLVNPRTGVDRGLRYYAWRVSAHVRAGTFVHALRRKARHLTGRAPRGGEDPRSPIYRQFEHARDCFRPPVVEGVPGLVLTTGDYESELSMPPWIWRDVFPAGVEEVRIEGGHYRLFGHPHTAAAISSVLQSVIGEAET